MALNWASRIFRVPIAANLKSHRQELVVAVDGKKDFQLWLNAQTAQRRSRSKRFWLLLRRSNAAGIRNWLEAMAKNLKLHRLSFMEERAILTFVTASRSLDEIAVRLNRRPDMIVRKARKLGISFDAVV